MVGSAPNGTLSNSCPWRRHAALTLAKNRPSMWVQTDTQSQARGLTAVGSHAPGPSASVASYATLHQRPRHARDCRGSVIFHGACKQLHQLSAHSLFEHIRAGADKLFAIKSTTQAHNKGMRWQGTCMQVSNGVDLSLDSVARYRAARPAFGRHGTQPST